jgi:hypothetical protein
VVLADVGDPDLAERGVEAEPPRVAQAGQDGLELGLAVVDVGGEDLAERVVEVLRAAAGVERAAAVAEAEVQAPIGAERELAPVVVLLRLVDEQQLPPRLGLALAELGDAGVAAAVGPVQEQAACPARRRASPGR